VCTKIPNLKNRDFGVRFIEWVHMIRILGAEKIHFPYDYVHPDILRIINYFEDKGMIETWRYLHPSAINSSDFRSWQGRQLQVNTLTDCFYKVMNLYDFVVILDIDEVIVPVREEDMSWNDIMRRMNLSELNDAYVSQNVYYPEVGATPLKTIPEKMYMLQHIERSRNFSSKREGVKSMLNTETVLAPHNHMPHKCMTNAYKNYQCKFYDFPTNISQNSHYRDFMDPGTDFNVTIEDKTIWKFKEQLTKAFLQTLIELDLNDTFSELVITWPTTRP
jgi:hypothetical protein